MKVVTQQFLLFTACQALFLPFIQLRWTYLTLHWDGEKSEGESLKLWKMYALSIVGELHFDNSDTWCEEILPCENNSGLS